MANANVVCLAMIVKNEGHIIERCLDAAKDSFQCVCITDTGSTDGTQQIIADWCGRNRVPFVICEMPWINFMVCRVASFTNAKKNFPDADYVITIDADMVLKFKDEFYTTDAYAQMTGIGINLKQVNLNVEYPNLRILSTAKDWTLKMWTHEFWCCEGMIKSSFDLMWIDDRNDGGSRADKFTRDIKLLTGQLEVETDYALINRAHFYRGQSYRYLAEKSGDDYKDMFYQLAISDYTHCANNHHSLEYRYDAMLKLAMCYRAKGDNVKAVGYYELAHLAMPNRAEPLFEIAMIYKSMIWEQTGQLWIDNHMKGQFSKRSLDYLIRAGSLSKPTNASLWVKYHLYDYKIECEIVTMAAWTSNHDRKHLGKNAALTLAQKAEVMPGHTRKWLHQTAIDHYGIDLRPMMEQRVDLDF